MSKDISYTILKIIGGAGLISLALVAPNALQLLPKIESVLASGRRRRYLSIAIKRLEDRGMLKISNDGNIKLTDKGKQELQKKSINELVARKPKIWDKKYRLIIFDIPERRRKIRVKLTAQLNAWGFARLQDSVWVYPYDCHEIVSLLKSYFYLGNDVLCVTAEYIENDKWLKRQFKLD